jgi:mycothiol system anti-sigma-R factor
VKPECEQALREIERFLDGEMGAPEHAKLDAHLHECPPCSDRAAFKRDVRQLISDRCGCDEVPAELKHRVLSLLDSAPPRPSADA